MEIKNIYGDVIWRNDFIVSLSGAGLSGAGLSGADLREANLSGADLSGADLANADLANAKLPKFQIDQRRSLKVWKKLFGGKIAKLRIPCRAKRTASPIGNKCRAERAFVIEIRDMVSGESFSEGYSMHEDSFKYTVGEYVSVPDFDDDIRVECTSGIHFFMTEEEAKKY